MDDEPELAETVSREISETAGWVCESIEEPTSKAACVVFSRPR